MKCPSCCGEVENLDYCKSFVFVDGVRHSGTWSWKLGCCGNYLMDDDLDMLAEEVEGKPSMVKVFLQDRDGNVLLSWNDFTPQEVADYGD